tara:strand:- start:3205 stop:3672 length:468 start_codon:yes stop_codon:yes gene_type:complete
MRRRRPEKRKIVPDPVYGDLVVAKFVNNLMKDGKKSVAEKIFYDSLNLISKKENTDSPLDIFKKALKNAAPVVEVKSKRIGGATYQVPIDIPENRRTALAMRWIITFARSRKGNSMVDRLCAELVSASKNEGSTIKKKEDTHKMAEANKAFSHFR